MEIIEVVDDTARTNVWSAAGWHFTIMEIIIHCSIIDPVVVNNWSSISVAVTASEEKNRKYQQFTTSTTDLTNGSRVTLFIDLTIW